MYTSWRRQETLTQCKQIERIAAKVAREIMFYRSGMSASIPTWARAIANDLSISQTEMRYALANKLSHDRGQF